jgi:hypothetical protein
VNDLSLKAALIYTWLLAHCDDQGRMSGDAATVRGIVCPLRSDITVDDVKLALSNMEDKDLIRIYEPPDMQWSPTPEIIQVLDWWDYQHLRDPQPSKYPAMRDWQDKIGNQSRDLRGRYTA